jgi:hypothetical protein
MHLTNGERTRECGIEIEIATGRWAGHSNEDGDVHLLTKQTEWVAHIVRRCKNLALPRFALACIELKCLRMYLESPRRPLAVQQSFRPLGVGYIMYARGTFHLW